MFRALAAWHFYFTPVPVDDWNYIPGQETIQESNSILPWTKAASKAWSKGLSCYTLERKALENFERIAKEGRKYGVGLLIVSQRPSDVSTTILSQCNNIISLRLSNDSDKSVVKGLMPDSLSGLLEILPGLEIGEAIIVGDAVLLPTRIVLNKPTHKPLSATIDFWQRWNSPKGTTDLVKAVEQLRRQSQNSDFNKAITTERGTVSRA